MHKIIAMWAVPRSVSTAFERMMMERGDHYVFHEPFSAYHYLSEIKSGNRFDGVKPDPQLNYQPILQNIIAQAHKSPVFFKDMGYHVSRCLSPDFIANFENTFIIRHPKKSLPSLHHKWPDFTDEEAGYEALYRVFELAAEVSGRTPPVIDADDLTKNAEATVKAFCRETRLRFMSKSLVWEPGSRREWRMWEGWHLEAEKSGGIKKTGKRKYPDINEVPRLQESYESCLPFYKILHANRLHPV